jgi:pimeloyl-ACP methyl ester carboxylesterase
MTGDELIRRWLDDPELSELASHASVDFEFRSDTGWCYHFVFDESGLAVDRKQTEATDFAVHLPHTGWLDLMGPQPMPRFQSVLGYLVPGAPGFVEGDQLAFAQSLHLVRRLIEVARPTGAEPRVSLPSAASIRGGYVGIEIEGLGTCEVFYERAGTGLPILMLPTAGSDSRQYHGLMADPALTESHELIAFDLPWHGKSNPAAEVRNTAYSLDSATYVGIIVAMIDALGLDRPVVLGSSMAGAVVVELAARAPEHISGAIGAQAGPRVANRRTEWARHPKVNQTLYAAEWTYGLMSPRSPKAYRDLVWWGYSQGGYGVYDADLGYYVEDWDIDRVAHLLDGSVPIVLLSGSYDYSVPPERTRELADRIPGAVFREMPELGHFPHAENPPVFSGYLLWALEQLRRKDHER